ncbi:MAG TPA: helix-turn-helix transcriptional regulator [Opitutaceae bacterium]|nr:helix-turn-helix transcriptional regulator [Opitutaceae bacterium]
MPQTDAEEDKVLACFGRNVRSHRKKLGISQEELAAEAGLDRAYMGGVERGERNLGLLNVARIAKALDVAASKLCEGIDA